MKEGEGALLAWPAGVERGKRVRGEGGAAEKGDRGPETKPPVTAASPCVEHARAYLTQHNRGAARAGLENPRG